MTSSYDSGKIRTLLTEGFSDEELRTLAFDVPGFKPVYHQLAHNTGKTEIVSRLMEHAERTRQLGQLLELAKSSNPAQYAQYEPYSYDHSATSSPYPGMQYFDVSDADRFFGRELLTAKLVGYLREQPFLAVVGASGSGKSSVVRAGLAPALQAGQPLADDKLPPEGSSQWPIHIITPTAHPLEAVAASLTRESESVTTMATLIDGMSKDGRSLHFYVRKLLARASTPSPTLPLRGGGGRLLLVVDQFEELFTLCRNEEERRAFVDNLLMAVDPETAGPTLIVITLRADFYAHCAQYENLREALARRQEYIGPMSSEELRRAIELPAQAAGYEFEPGLVDLILRDVGHEPGALPLLSHALLETWRRRQGRTLTLPGYADAGGVRGAIAQTAESVFGHLTPERQSIARRIFLRLTELGEGAQDTRRRVSRAELEMMNDDRRPETGDSGGEQSPVPGRPSPVAAVLQTLVAARLVTTDQDTAEVAHEALIREWPTLRQWLNDNREGLRLHRHLSEAAQEWQRLNRDPSVLYRGAKLAQTSEWAEQHPAELNTLEHQFLTAGKQAGENERLRELEQARVLAEEQQRRAEVERQRAEEQKQAAINLRKWALIATGIGVLALIAAIAAGFFGWQANENAKLAATREAEAKQQADRANAHRLAAEGQLQFEKKPLVGLRLALEGQALSSAYSQIDQNIRSMAQHGRLLTLGQGDVEGIYATDDSPSTFILVRANTPSELRRSADGILIETPSGPVNNEFNNVAFTDEAGRYFLVNDTDGTPVELRRSADGTLIATFAGPVRNVYLSPDEAVTYFVVSYRDVTPGELRRTADRTLIEALPSPIDAVTFSSDKAASYFVVSYSDDTPSELRRSADGTLIETLSGPVRDFDGVIFSPDEAASYFVVNYIDGTPAELRRSADGILIKALSGPVKDFGVTFSQDEAASFFVVSYSDVTPGELRRTADGTLIEALPGQVYNMTFSQDEAASYFVVSYSDVTPGELRRTADGTLVKTLSGPVYNVTFNPDEAASYFVVSYSDVTPGELRRTADGTLIEALPGQVYNVTFSQDEAASYFVISYISDTPGELRRTADGTLIKALPSPIDAVTFSSDEAASYFVVNYRDGRSELWQRQGEPRRLTELGLGLERYHFDVASDRFITQYSDGRAYLLDLAWLRAMGGKAEKMPIEELVRIVCKGPFASELFDEGELKFYLEEREPQVCK